MFSFLKRSDNTPIGTCEICKNQIDKGSPQIECFQCGHLYHEQHLRLWYKENDFCPICKDGLEEEFNRVDYHKGRGQCVFCTTPVKGDNCSTCRFRCSMCFKAITYDQDYSRCRHCESLFHDTHMKLYEMAKSHCRVCTGASATAPFTNTGKAAYKSIELSHDNRTALFFVSLFFGLGALLMGGAAILEIISFLPQWVRQLGTALVWINAFLLGYLFYGTVTTLVRVIFASARKTPLADTMTTDLPLLRKARFFLRSLLDFDKKDRSNYLAITYIVVLFGYSVYSFAKYGVGNLGSVSGDLINIVSALVFAYVVFYFIFKFFKR